MFVPVIPNEADGMNGPPKWIEGIKRNLHSHDIQALAMESRNNYLISGGDDFLFLSKIQLSSKQTQNFKTCVYSGRFNVICDNASVKCVDLLYSVTSLT